MGGTTWGRAAPVRAPQHPDTLDVTAGSATPAAGPRPPWFVWALPALLTAALTAPGLSRPVLWQDELATLSAASRSLPDLVRLTAHVDAVLGPYYAFMAAWTQVAGTSPVALRLPSALAMAAGTAVAALVGHRLWGARAGLAAGLVLALSPTVAQYGAEARPYGFTLLAAALATLALLGALARPSRASWSRYGVAIVLLGLLQLTAVALVPAHLLAVAFLTPGVRRARMRQALATFGAALVLLSPVLAVGHHQQGQIDWIPEPTWSAVIGVPGRLWGSPGTLALVVVLAVAAVLGLRPAPTAGGARAVPWGPRFGPTLGLAVALLPIAVIGLLSLAVPLVRHRYLLYTQLGWALLAGAVLARAGLKVAVVLLVALAALTGPGHVDLHRSLKDPGSPDYRGMAAILGGQARPGDAIVVPTDKGVRFRVGLAAYTGGHRLPHDALAVRAAVPAASLDARECRPALCLGSPTRLWVGCRGRCGDPLSSLRPETRALIRDDGYVPARTWHLESGALSLYLRPSASET